MNTPPSTQREIINFFNILLKRKWIIIISVSLFIIFSLYISLNMAPIYRASTKIVFEEKESKIQEIGIPSLHLKATIIQNIIEEIQSWSLINEVLTSLPDSVIETFHVPQRLSPTDNKIEYLTFIERHLI